MVENRSLSNGIGDARITLDRQLIPYYTATYQFQSDEMLTKAECIPLAVRYGCQILQKHGLNVFSQPAVSLSNLKEADGEAVCIIESVNGSLLKEAEESTIKSDDKDKSIIITGWAVDNNNATSATGVVLDIDG
ncbi:MAG: hypothetical protein NTX52_05140, partial [Planctomycetota bacterium]|nr:hypothetical protein [Planctomycetota bacterium]